MKLEELARQSSAAARTSVSTLEPPPIGESERPRRLAPALAGTAVVALLVGGLAAISRNDSDVLPAVSDQPSDAPRLALGPDARGWQPLSARPIGEIDTGTVATPSFAYYGTSGADDPFAAGDLVIGTIADLDEPASDDGTEIDIRGTTGRLANERNELGIIEAAAVEWTEFDAAGNRLDLVVISRSFDQTALVDIVENMTVDVAEGTAVPGDGLDLDLLAESDELPLFGATGDDGWAVRYLDLAFEESTITLTSAIGSLEERSITLRWWADEVENVLIDDDPGLLVSVPVEFSGSSGQGESVSNTILLWSPEPGVVATISSFDGIDRITIEWLAWDVVELTPAEWAALADSTSLTPDGPVAVEDGVPALTEIVAEGGGEIDGAGYSWVASAADGGFCVEINTASGGGASCGGPESALVETGSAAVWAGGAADGELADGDAVRWGVIVADPMVDELRPSDQQLTVDRFEWGGSSWFVLVGPAGDNTEVDVVVAGDVVDTLDFATGGDPRPAPPGADGLASEFPALADAGHGDVVFVADGTTDGLRWAIGESVAGLCLYTAGIADSISCNDFGGIAVFPSLAVESATWSFIYSTHRDRCPIVLSSGTSPIVDMVTDGVNSVWIVEGESDGWQFGVEGQMVDIPTGGGSIEWPAGTCLP